MFIHSLSRIKTSSFTVSYSYCSCFIKKQSIYISGYFHCFTRFGYDVGTQSTIQPGDTDSRKQSSDSGGNEADKQGQKRSNGNDSSRIIGKRFKGDTHNDKDQCKCC